MSKILSQLVAPAALLLLLATAGCRSTDTLVHHRNPAFDPSAELPLRLAVLPFEDRTGGRAWWIYPLVPFIWFANVLTLNLPEDAPDPDVGRRVLRNLLVAWMNSSSRLDVLSPLAVDTTLRHHGLLERASQLSPRRLGKLLDVDAVMYCTLEEWGSDYYVLDSRQLIQGTVLVRSAYDGSELYRATTTTTDRAGVSQIPAVTSVSPHSIAGIISTPLDALGEGDYDQLAIYWVAHATWEFLRVDLGEEAEGERDEDMGEMPHLSLVAVNSRSTGVFREGDLIQIMAAGTPGGQASFDLGPLRRSIPMSEIARGEVHAVHGDRTAGRYVGSYFVMPGDHLAGAPVTVRLRSGKGRVARMQSATIVTIDARAVTPETR